MKLKSTQLLEDKGINFRLIKLSQKGVSSEDVIKNAEEEINSEEICKTMIVKDEQENYYAILLKGDDKIDFNKAKKIIGRKLSMISIEKLKQLTNKGPGAVCPLLLNLPIYVDNNVFNTEKINFGSGNHLYGIEINSKDLNKIIKFKTVNISK